MDGLIISTIIVENIGNMDRVNIIND